MNDINKHIKTYYLTALSILLIGGALIMSSNIVSSSTVTVSATVASSITCTTDNTTTSFGTLTTGAIATSSLTASTSLSCSNVATGCTLFVADAGNGTNGGLATTSPAYLIPSPAAGFPTTATLVAGTEGYGIQATSTAVGSGATLGFNTIYNSYNTNTVGKLATTTQVVASSTSQTTNREVVVKHKAAISGTTQAATYTDTITYSCLGN